jgi:hypothetical protein
MCVETQGILLNTGVLLLELSLELPNRSYMLYDCLTEKPKKYYSGSKKASTKKASKIPVINVNQFFRSLINNIQ